MSAPLDEDESEFADTLTDIEVRLWSLRAGAQHQLQAGDETPLVILEVLLFELDRLQGRIERRRRGESA
jgi:hypothetical protein